MELDREYRTQIEMYGSKRKINNRYIQVRFCFIIDEYVLPFPL